jgi:hypothetical protein
MSSSEEEITSDEEIDLTDIEDAFKTVIEGLTTCLKGLQELKKDSRDIVIKGLSLGQLVRDCIGPDFGKKVINSLMRK